MTLSQCGWVIRNIALRLKVLDLRLASVFVAGVVNSSGVTYAIRVALFKGYLSALPPTPPYTS
jgi:hypothetical protein